MTHILYHVAALTLFVGAGLFGLAVIHRAMRHMIRTHIQLYDIRKGK